MKFLWQQADAAQAGAQNRYPEMRCLTGCNDCCKHHGSPITHASEWQAIENWLTSRPELIAQVQQRHQALKQGLQAKLEALSTPSLNEALFALPCPFIANSPEGERCSIYSVRPLTCRAFGNTLLQPAVSREDLYTCAPEQDRWEQELPMAEIKLPLRAPLFEPLANDRRRSLLNFLERYLHQLAIDAEAAGQAV